MRGSAWLALCLCLFLSPSCTNIDQYRGIEGPPGGYVTGASQANRVFTAFSPNGSGGYGAAWVLVRVVAPPAATRCWVTGQSPFSPPGPLTAGVPDAQHEVMLTYQSLASSASFACRTPDGDVRRTVRAVPYHLPPTSYTPRWVSSLATQVKPPLVHMDPTDTEAEHRWQKLAAEICPTVSETAFYFVCRPGMLEKLTAEDLGGAVKVE